MNSSGEVIGTETESSGTHVLLWTSTSATPQDLGTTAALIPVMGLNDAGTVVWSSYSSTSFTGSIYTATGGVKDLDTLLDSSGAGYTIQSGSAINTGGWIAAVAKGPGGGITPVVLTPDP